jgi:hypothetical protein
MTLSREKTITSEKKKGMKGGGKASQISMLEEGLKGCGSKRERII